MIHNSQKTIYQCFVKYATHTAGNHLNGYVLRKSLLITAITCQGIKGVGKRNHLCRDGNLIPLEAIRITGSVIAFMMTAGNFCCILLDLRIKFSKIKFTNNILTKNGMFFNNIIFYRRKFSRIIQDAFRYLGFSDIM